MPYKPIDFQMSIPRTPDTSAHQSQMIHRPLADQMSLERDTAKQTEQARNRNAGVDETGNQGISSNRDRDSRSPSQRKRRSTEKEEHDAKKDDSAGGRHPFKGKHIDYTL